jgi:hypothetical protein
VKSLSSVVIQGLRKKAENVSLSVEFLTLVARFALSIAHDRGVGHTFPIPISGQGQTSKFFEVLQEMAEKKQTPKREF